MIGIKAEDWTIPGGKLEASETFEEAAIRETIEETGMRCEITGLFKVFHYIHLYHGEQVAEWYVPAFTGKITGETGSYNTKEIRKTRRFTELPSGFAGELNQYYDDLMEFISEV